MLQSWFEGNLLLATQKSQLFSAVLDCHPSSQEPSLLQEHSNESLYIMQGHNAWDVLTRAQAARGSRAVSTVMNSSR
jgi:hypothetical protein